MRLSTSWGLSVRLKAADGALQRELDLHLEPMAAFETATFDLVILADLSSLGREPTISKISNFPFAKGIHLMIHFFVLFSLSATFNRAKTAS